VYFVLFEIPETNFVGQKNVPIHVQGYYTHTPPQNCFSGLISVYYTFTIYVWKTQNMYDNEKIVLKSLVGLVYDI
jgi:hypothetical protein